MKKISIKINSKDIVIVEANKTGNSVTVLKTVTTNTPEECFDNGNIKNVVLMGKALSSALKESKITTKDAIFLINSSAVISRSVKLPKIDNRDDAISMIKNELDQLMPLDLSRYSFVYSVVDTFAENNQQKAEYLAHGIPTEIIDSYVKLAEQVGLRASNIDFAFNTLDPVSGNDLLVNGNTATSGKTIGYIDFSRDIPVFSVYKRGVNVFTRVCTKTFKNYEKEMSNVANVSMDKVKKALLKFDATANYDLVSDEEERNTYMAIKHSISEFATEVSKYVKYYNSQNSGAGIDKVFIYGPYARMNNIDTFMTEEFLTEVETINTVTGINGYVKDNPKELREYFDAIIACMVGKDKLNFYSKNAGQHQMKFRLLVIGLAVGLPIALALIFVVFSAIIEVAQLKSELNRMKRFDNDPNNLAIQAESNRIKAELDIMKGQETLLVANVAKNEIMDIVTGKKYEDISSITPANAYIENITVSAGVGNGLGTIQIQGAAGDVGAVAQYENNLKTLPFVETVFSPTISRTGENYSFIIICQVKQVKDVMVDEAE